jgi:hypothetical protein
VQKLPSVLAYNVKDKIEPTIKFYEDCVGSNAAIQMIAEDPSFISYSLKKTGSSQDWHKSKRLAFPSSTQGPFPGWLNIHRRLVVHKFGIPKDQTIETKTTR